MRLGRCSAALALLAAAACAGPNASSPSMPASALHAPTLGGAAPEATLQPARLLPEQIDDQQGYGSEPGGGIRSMTAGLRIVTSPHGAFQVAEDRFTQAPSLTTALPERLGGGFLFVIGATIWRADRWLAPARPIFTSAQAVQASRDRDTPIVLGLDRVYVRTSGGYVAIDGRTGQPLDLGPWPASPSVSTYAAADGWRAAAITDLRGVVATFDAGATWRTLELPIDPRFVATQGEMLLVGGFEPGRNEAWYEVRPDGSVGRAASAPRDARMRSAPSAPSASRPSMTPFLPTVPTSVPSSGRARDTAPGARDEDRATRTDDAATRTFGARPLVAAIEDGWPLADGTAIVARDGALGRVRVSDGALVEFVPGAYPLKPSRCHAVPLGRGGVAFVCGEARGATALYAYDPARGALTPLRLFERPRAVMASGNGGLAVRGACAEDAEPTVPSPKLVVQSPAREHEDHEARDVVRSEAPTVLTPAPAEDDAAASAYCVYGVDRIWREVHVRGTSDGGRVVVLGDGRIAVISPPQSAGASGRLTLLDKGRATTVPIAFPSAAPDVARVLRLGVWLDGFEERRPGVLGGWIEAGGVMLGVEITLDGNATPGQFIREAGMPFVSGRYGLGWLASRRAYETTDGGMTWKPVEVPEPLTPPSKVQHRACGPLGCVAAGWVRVGWGEASRPTAPPPPAPYRPTVTAPPPQLSLACEPLVPRPPDAAKAPARPLPPPPPRRPFLGSAVLGPPNAATVTEMPPFYAQPGPPLRDGERGLPIEVQELPERNPRLGPLARVYGWGPKTGDWDTQGKWQVKWLSPFAAWPDVRSSVPSLPPQVLLDATRAGAAYGFGGYGTTSWHLATGDDAAHAMLLSRRVSRSELALFELEADRAPVEIRRADGEPFVEIEGFVRAAGRWYLATPASAGTRPQTTIWQVDGGVARELARVPRVETARGTSTRLARRSDGRAIGLVVDGQASPERSVAQRWVLPIDLEGGLLGEPEPLGYADLGGRKLEACADEGVGWILDASLPGASVRLHLPTGTGSLQSLYARLQVSSSRACIDKLAGIYDGQTPERAAQLARPAARAPAALHPGDVAVSVLAGQSRYGLRCSLQP